jgi:hypothetical protein
MLIERANGAALSYGNQEAMRGIKKEGVYYLNISTQI